MEFAPPIRVVFFGLGLAVEGVFGVVSFCSWFMVGAFLFCDAWSVFILLIRLLGGILFSAFSWCVVGW